MLVTLFMLCPRALYAQVTVNAGLSQAEVTVGEPVQLTIQIRGTNQLIEQPVIEIPGLEVQSAGMSPATLNINGVVQIFASYNYLVSTDKPGEFEIPVLDVPIEGQIYKTQAMKLKVNPEPAPVDPQNDPLRPIFKLETSKSEIFESETIAVTMTLFIHEGVNLTELPFPNLPRDNFAMKRFQHNPDRSRVQINGSLYTAFYFRTSINPLTSGDLVLGPADIKLELQVPDGTGRRDRFGFMSAKAKKYTAKSDPLMMHVKPLPEAGKPSNFSGAVGRFTTQIQANPLKLMQGDPIAATLTISGVGNFESLNAPEMENRAGWRLYPAKQMQDNRNSGLEPGTVIYSQVLIPDQVQTQIPAFVLNYFNPDTAKYEEARTVAIPIQVAADTNAQIAATANAPSAGASAIQDFTFANKDIPKEELTGVLSVLRTNGNMLALHTAPFTLRYPWLVHAIAGSLLAVILLLALANKRKAASAVQQEKVAAPAKAADILRALKSEHANLRQFYTLAAEYLTAWQREGNVPPMPDSPGAAMTKRVRMRRDFYSYGTADAATQPVPDSEHQEIVAGLQQL